MATGDGQVVSAAANNIDRLDMATIVKFGRGDTHYPAVEALRTGQPDHEPRQGLHCPVETFDGDGGDIGEVSGGRLVHGRTWRRMRFSIQAPSRGRSCSKA